MAYDTRTATGIPTEPVGSLPRPSKLQAAYADYDDGKITQEELETEQDAAVKDSIENGEATGAPIVSDGEQRWSSFATYPITDTLAGTGLADNLAGDGGQYFAIFADGHHRQLPRLTGGPFKLQDLRRGHAEEVDQVRDQAHEAGGDRALDAGPALSARGRGAGLLARAVRGQTSPTRPKRTSGRPSPRAPSVSRSTSPRDGWPRATIRATRGPAQACCRTSSTSTTG